MPHVLVAGRIHDAGLALLRSASGVTFDLVEEVSTESYPLLLNMRMLYSSGPSQCRRP